MHKKKEINFFASAFNFGPKISSAKTVEELVRKFSLFWEGEPKIDFCISEYHETNTLNLISDKAIKHLNWQPKWDFEKTIKNTADWYFEVYKGKEPFNKCLENIVEYNKY